MYPEGHEMKAYHRSVLTHTRLYILHNLRPSELIWSSLMAKDVLSADMVEEIKANVTNTQQVAALLDILPARGPSTFDAFCDTLLECDHVHVAEHLKNVEATDQFREEIKRHGGPDFTDNHIDKFVATFKRTTPAMTRFAERKFEVLLEEREDEINAKESEISRLEAANTKLKLQADQTASFLDSFYNVSKTIAEEVQQQVPSKHFLNEEIAQLMNLRKQVGSASGTEQAANYYHNMEIIVRFIEKHCDMIISANAKTNKHREKSCLHLNVGSDASLLEKMQGLASSMSQFIDDMGQYSSIPTDNLRTELQKVHKHAQNMADDLMLVNSKFQAVLKTKKKVETEVFSLLHNMKETRRLEREVKEKRNHIADLSKQGQLIRKKARSHRRELEQIKLNLTQKKLQLADVQKALESQLNSADVRMHVILKLLPDEVGDTDSVPDTESLGTSTPFTDDLRSLSGSLPRMKQNGDTYTLKSPLAMSPRKTNGATPHATAISNGSASNGATQHPKSVNSVNAKADGAMVGKSTGESNAGASNRTDTKTSHDTKSNSETAKSQGKKIEGAENKPDAAASQRTPYRSRVIIPRQRQPRPTFRVAKAQMVSERKMENDLAVNSKPADNADCDKVSTEMQLGAKPGLDTARKTTAKRQHDSYPDTDSSPSSADSSKPKWPPPKKSLNHEADSESDENEELEDKEETDKDIKTENAKGMEEDKVKGDEPEDSKPQLMTKKLTTSSTTASQASRYQYMLKPNRGSSLSPTKVPMGLSRDEYWQYVRNQHQAQDPLLGIGGMNLPIAREIPASVSHQTTMVKQTSNNRHDEDRKTQGSALREAFATKRVEPSFKLPNNGR